MELNSPDDLKWAACKFQSGQSLRITWIEKRFCDVHIYLFSNLWLIEYSYSDLECSQSCKGGKSFNLHLTVLYISIDLCLSLCRTTRRTPQGQ